MATGESSRERIRGRVGVRRLPSRSGRPPDQRGQNTLEYLGLLVVVAVVVVALATTTVGDTVSAALERVIRCIATGQAGGRCTPHVQAQTLTPLQRATQGDYVALGDSYSSGEGGSEYLPGTDVDGKWKEKVDDWIPFYDSTEAERHNLCHRSTKAYSQSVYDEYDFEGDYDFHACSGAEVKDLLPGDQPPDENNDGVPDGENVPDHANVGESPQLEHLNEDTSLVTVSIGGNDVGFAEVIKSCLWRGVVETAASCEEDMGESTRRKIRNLKDDLVDLYNKMQGRAPNARILVVGYPRMFPDDPIGPLEVGPSLETGDLDEPIDPADQRWMNEMGRLLNQTTKQAAEEAGVEFVDVHDALEGHEIGTEDSWINDLDLSLENGGFADMGSFHPNDQGHAAIARRVKQQVRQGDGE